MNPKYQYPDKKNSRAFEILDEIPRKHRKLLLGITGAGGAGKTTFANNIIKYVGNEQSCSIDLDDYLLSREERGKLEVTGYNPRANKLYLAREHLERLLSGKSVDKPRYDHSTGKVLENEIIAPKDLIVVEGVTTLYPELRELFPRSFYLDALKETQIKSRIERDVKQRGYSLDEALALYEAVQPDFKRFIEPTKRFASVIFQVDTDYIMHPIHIARFI
jgi:phosphoribulokinase